MKALLALEDGFFLWGRSFTGPGEAVGEVVFNTSMTGYQEILTDPSYKGQIVTMTYPLIGNYGVNDEDIESLAVCVQGFLIREYSPCISNWRAKKDLGTYLREAGVLGVEGIDTRALTRHIRRSGAMKGAVSTSILNPEDLVARARAWPGLVGQDLVKEVTTKRPYRWPEGDSALQWTTDKPYKVVAYDYGIKFNILRHLEYRGCEVLVVPADTPSSTVESLNPHAVFLSNGPGDPAGVTYAIDTVRELIPMFPIFGICLGHQLLGLAFGGRTYKLKFGHRGSNQPVKDLHTGKIEITSQNHGFCVDIDSLKGQGLEITHVNLNDGTLEGMRHRTLPVFSVQFHPEASPGPHDTTYLFERFIHMIQKSLS
nr:glutamine-hydrolyzing carbamoyl-phosphate synthase small subunit [Desulfobacterales bacterium]